MPMKSVVNCTQTTFTNAEKLFYNKAFKSDSQRLAFSVPMLGSVFMVQWLRLGGSVAHTLMRRYVSE